MRPVKKIFCYLALALFVTVVILVYKQPGYVVNITYKIHPRNLLEYESWKPVEQYDHISYKRKEPIARKLTTNDCKCEKGETSLTTLISGVSVTELEKVFHATELQEVKQRREKEYQHFVQRTKSSADKLLIAKANSPLEYPTQGVEVRPMKTILIPGLSLQAKSQHRFEVNLMANLGTFAVAAEVDGVKVEGEGEMQLSLSSSEVDNLNRQLQFVTYTNTVFNPNTADTGSPPKSRMTCFYTNTCSQVTDESNAGPTVSVTVLFKADGHQAEFTIKIRHPIIPKLYDVSNQSGCNISALVTIATKTFLRYDKLRQLISSIRKYYPTVTIIIADDSDKLQKIEGAFIEQYFMPFKKGWFAGRNLAVSQVKTKYLLWVDDDFIFAADTKLEKMVDILEKTTLDLVGGSVREITSYSATFRHKLSVESGGMDGDCLNIQKGYYHEVEGFPDCVITDATINFFMARTEKMQQVGFDPHIARQGHLEFFIDGLGLLHVGSCSDVKVDHASKIKMPWTKKSESEKTYAQFRYVQPSEEDANLQDKLLYFKNRFKCIRHS